MKSSLSRTRTSVFSSATTDAVLGSLIIRAISQKISQVQISATFSSSLITSTLPDSMIYALLFDLSHSLIIISPFLKNCVSDISTKYDTSSLDNPSKI